MDQFLPLAQKLQVIEAYLNNLVASLQRGELPVNLQHITQVFDQAIGELPRLSLPPEKFCAVYNDLPSILSAYAITVTLNAASYRQTHRQIIFERLYNGNYWIIPITATPDQAWLVPNPTRKIDLTRLDSLPFAFDWPERHSTPYSTYSLAAPAIVSLLPTAPVTWKLLQRGSISPFLTTDAQHHNQAVTGELIEIEAMVAQAMADRLAELKSEILSELRAELQGFPRVLEHPSPPETIEATFVDGADPAVLERMPHRAADFATTTSLGDLWRQSLMEMMVPIEDDGSPPPEDQ